MSALLADPGDSSVYEIDWSNELETGVTLTSVTHTVPSPLTKVSESAEDTSSFVRISGAVHGGLYMIEASAVISTGETINRQFPLRGFNS